MSIIHVANHSRFRVCDPVSRTANDKETVMASLLPNNPMMLLSVVNTQLRDEFSSLEELCAFFNQDRSELEEKLAAIDYSYDPDLNRFV